MISGCTCVIHGWGRIPNPGCPIHNSHPRPLLRVVRESTANLVCTLCHATITHNGVGCSWGCPANFVHGCAPRGHQWWEPRIDAKEIKAHEELLLALLKEHRATCVLCHDREDLWVACALGEVLRAAWFNAFRLLVQPTRWSTVETVRPFQMGGVS